MYRLFISMAKHLGIRVIAEGVELEEQVEFLKSSNCDEIQGFLISRPMIADNIVTLFEQKLLPIPKSDDYSLRNPID